MTPATATAAPPLAVRLLEDPRVRLAFSDRRTGNVSLRVGPADGNPSADAMAARRRLAAAVGLAPDEAVYAEQVHAAGVAVVGSGERGRGARRHSGAVAAVDALVTADEGVGVVVQAADCVPLLMVLPGVAVAAVHAGRRGVEAGVVPAALDVLEALGGAAASRQVIAVIGPAIGGCCYEVPADLAARVVAALPAAAASTTWGAPALDLPAGVAAQLRDRGVARIERAGGCTRCNGGLWFSARAASAGEQPDGRHAGIVARLPDTSHEAA